MSVKSEPATRVALPEAVITRVFDAPRELVWKAWTEARHLRQWYGPRGYTAPDAEIDLRPGGKINLDMHDPNGLVITSDNVIDEVVPPERLVFTSSSSHDEHGVPKFQMRTTITLSEHSGRTTLVLKTKVIKATFPVSAASMEGMNQGWNQALDKMGELLARLQTAS